MKKIPTIFERDWDGDPQRVTSVQKISVLGAVATRKVDGTAVSVQGGKLFKRRTVKDGKVPPTGFIEVDRDDTTGKLFGWEPVFLDQKSDRMYKRAEVPVKDGTYAFIGTKIQGNAGGVEKYAYIPHGDEALAVFWKSDVEPTREMLLEFLSSQPIEGIVWWRDGQPIGKIKRRDFGLPWPICERRG